MHKKNEQKTQEKLRKKWQKILKNSDKKLWAKLSSEERNKVIKKYYELTDIENIGINSALNDFRQTRLTFASLIIGLILGVVGGMFGSILLKYISLGGWIFDLYFMIGFCIFFASLFKLVDNISTEDLRDYRILEHLSKLVKKDKKVKKKI